MNAAITKRQSWLARQPHDEIDNPPPLSTQRGASQSMLNHLLPILFALTAIAQDRPLIPHAGEAIDVSIVNVDVVVTDKKGNHVQGLTKDDFEIYENGKLQPLSNFAEYRGGRETVLEAAKAGAAPSEARIENAPRPKRTILVFIDHFSLLPWDREQFFSSLKTLLHQSLGHGDAVSIVSWDRMISTRLSFTDDLAELDKALTQIEKESTFLSPDSRAQEERERLWRSNGMAFAQTKGFAIDNRMFDATTFSTGRDHAMYEKLEVRSKIAAMRSLVTGISAFEGKKVMLFATNRFPRYAGTAAAEAKAPDGSSDYDMFRFIESLGQTAATNNVTIYPLYPRGLDSEQNSAENVDRTPPAQTSVDLQNQLSAMNLVADRTGGATAWGAKNIAEFLPKVREDLDAYYSLAYRVTPNKDNHDRSITVKTKNRDYTARARRDYVDKSPVELMKDRVIASFFRAPAGAKIPLAVVAGPAKKRSNHHWAVTVHVEIPIAALTTLPENAQQTGGFSVYTGWGGVLGELSEVRRQTQSFAFPTSKQKEAMNGHYSYDVPLDIDESTESVVIGVVDEVSQEFGIRKIELPPRKDAPGTRTD
jgi:VWFA-related protein